MNGFKFAYAIKKLEKKYKKCPKCGKETEIEMHNEIIYISCKCGFKIESDENAKILKSTE